MLKSDGRCLPVQKQVFEAFQPGKAVNSFEPRNTPGEGLRKDGVLYKSDVCFSTEYPNSFLDIWYPSADRSVKRPTVFYMHGGGFIFGDKVMGDPLAVKSGRDIDFCADVCKHGYNVIAPNYALAPEYRFPAQIKQVDAMLSYLTAHQTELGLDMERIFLGGGSAGACLAEIYGAALTQPDYAAYIGFTPSIRKEQLHGLLIDEAPLSVRNFDEGITAMIGCFMGVDDFTHEEDELRLDVTKWIKAPFIPSFINSSNVQQPFIDAAKDLAAALDRVGTPYEFFFRGQECGKLEHGYMQQFKSEPNAKDCYEHLLAFISKYSN